MKIKKCFQYPLRHTLSVIAGRVAGDRQIRKSLNEILRGEFTPKNKTVQQNFIKRNLGHSSFSMHNFSCI